MHIKDEYQFFRLGFDRDFVISATSAFVTSPFINFNSSIASSLVNPFFVNSLKSFSGKGDGIKDDAELAVVVGWFDLSWRRLSAKNRIKTNISINLFSRVLLMHRLFYLIILKIK